MNKNQNIVVSRLTKKKGDDFITCVLHELVHVKQYFKKELKDINGVEMRWKGETHIGIDYYNLPWEKYFYELQESLLIEYKNREVYNEDRRFNS